MIFTKRTKMANLLHANFSLVAVMDRFGIKLGFGDASIAEVCSDYGINVDFFLEIANAFHDELYFAEEELQSFPLKLLVDYLSKTHRVYLTHKVPEIEGLIDGVVNDNKDTIPNLYLMKNFFHEYVVELHAHISYEEDVIFPYVLKLERAYNKGIFPEPYKEQVMANFITSYASEHTDVEDKLLDLKNLIIKYLPPPADSKNYNRILSGLFSLEKDLLDHSRIEEGVMVPKVTFLENSLQEQLNGQL